MDTASREIISGLAELLGLIGALLLAIPFVKTQKLRDAIISFQRPEDITDPEFQEAAAISLRNLQNLIGARASRDYRYGIVGFFLIGLGFAIKLLPVSAVVWEFLVNYFVGVFTR
jgi:hypothetical protein